MYRANLKDKMTKFFWEISIEPSDELAYPRKPSLGQLDAEEIGDDCHDEQLHPDDV